MGKTFTGPNGELEAGLQIKEGDCSMLELPSDDAFCLQSKTIAIELELSF